MFHSAGPNSFGSRRIWWTLVVSLFSAQLHGIRVHVPGTGSTMRGPLARQCSLWNQILQRVCPPDHARQLSAMTTSLQVPGGRVPPLHWTPNVSGCGELLLPGPAQATFGGTAAARRPSGTAARLCKVGAHTAITFGLRGWGTPTAMHCNDHNVRTEQRMPGFAGGLQSRERRNGHWCVTLSQVVISGQWQP